jgi:hypothetical protein
VRCLAGLVGDFMIIFSCPACGGGAFTLSEDFSEVHCATPLGSWQALRRDISKALVTLGESPSSAQHGSTLANGDE